MPRPLPRTIAVDGPAGAGKTSICSAVARELHYLFVDTGAFYRAVTLAAIQAGIGDADEASILEVARQSHLDIHSAAEAEHDDGRDYTIILNSKDVTAAVRRPDVDATVSRIAAMGSVRTLLNMRYRTLAEQGSVIMAGRDITTVVLPNADLKIYLDASPEARAERRYQQRIAAGQTANLDEILSGLRTRDAYDAGREIDPLRRAPDAKYVTTDDLTIPEAIERVKQIILNWPN